MIWSDLSWAAPGLLMGLVGGVHCTAMCGGACVMLTRRRHGADASDQGFSRAPLGAFVGARFVSYVVAGVLAGGSAAWADQFARQASWLHPFWMLVLTLSAMMGAWLMLAGRWPAFQVSLGRSSARRVWSIHPVSAATAAGLALPSLPCGLLYGALLLAGLSGGVTSGAAVMAGFALGSAPWLLAVPLGLAWWRGAREATQAGVLETYGFRAAGMFILVSASWSIWRSVTPNGVC